MGTITKYPTGTFDSTSSTTNYVSKEKILTLSASGSASSNTAAIQALLNVGGNIRLTGDGVAQVNDSLVLYDNTNLVVDRGLTLIQKSYQQKTMFKTSHNADAGTSVTLTWTQGLRTTVNWVAHGKAVGDYIWISGADQAQFNGVFLIYSVTSVDAFVVVLDRMPTVTATGTIVAKIPNKNITLDVRGTLDLDQANKAGGGGSIDLLAIRLSGVNINVPNLNINNASKYCLCIAAARHVRIANIHSDMNNSDLIKVYGPSYDVSIDGVTGRSNDDFISLQGIEPAAYLGYMWSSGDVINVRLKNINPDTTDTSGTITLYGSDSGEIVDNIVVENCDVVNRITISSNAGGSAGLIGNLILKNLKAPDDTGRAVGGVSTTLTGTIEGITLQDTIGSYWPKEYITIAATTTVKKMTVKNNSLIVGANYIVNNLGTITFLNIYDNHIQPSTTSLFVKIVKNAKTITHYNFFNNKTYRMVSALEQVAGATDGCTVAIRDNYLQDNYGVCTMIMNCDVRFTGNVGNIITARVILNINGGSKLMRVKTDSNVLTFAGTAAFITRTVGNELIVVNGTDIPVALDLLTRTYPGQIVKAAAAIGTILINETCVSDTTNTTNSWHQLSNPALVY
jgi:hypothetical protein